MKANWKSRFITPPENAGQIVFRLLSAPIVKVLGRSGITPNQVTIVRGVVAVVSLWLFANGDPRSLLFAVLLFYVFELLDHVDGDLARFTGRFSKAGPLLEQFIDTWASRPSNIFGMCIALGMYNQTGQVIGFVLYGATALGRMLWLEYRDSFGWQRESQEASKQYKSVIGAPSFLVGVRQLFEILYIWNNSFLLLGALLYMPVKAWLEIDTLVVGFAIVAVLNNLPWIYIVIRGFARARAE